MADLIARLRVGGVRRVVAVVAMTLLGGILLWLAASEGMGAIWRAILILFGGICLLGAWRVQKATEADLLLTREGLFEASGQRIVALDNIEALDRGIFALKPTTGFVLRLKNPEPFGWAPGVWWRFGRRLGVGGSVSGVEVKGMAEMIELVLADRAGLLSRD